MPRVRDRGGDRGEAIGCSKGERCVHRVVECVDDVVRCPGMVGVPREEVEGDGAGLHPLPDVLVGIQVGDRLDGQ